MTTWISHRGYCANATENTAAAFDAALEHGFKHIETDLRATKDGHIVLCHDDSLKRTAGSDWRIAECTRKELEQVRLKNGEPLLFFDKFLERYGHLRCILDIKGGNTEVTLQQLEKWQQDPAVEAFLRERTRFLLWKSHHERQLKSQLDDAFCLAGSVDCYRAGFAALLGMPRLGGIQPNQYYAVPPTLKGLPVLHDKLVRRFHNQDARVIGYLPETRAEHQQALDAGVDELLTNHIPSVLED